MAEESNGQRTDDAHEDRTRVATVVTRVGSLLSSFFFGSFACRGPDEVGPVKLGGSSVAFAHSPPITYLGLVCPSLSCPGAECAYGTGSFGASLISLAGSSYPAAAEEFHLD